MQKLCHAVGAGKYQQDQYEQRLQNYNANPTNCQHCNVLLPYTQLHTDRKFCSKSCAATVSNSKRVRVRNTYPHRQINCACCNVSFCPLSLKKKLCSSRCADELRSRRIITPESRLKMSVGGRKSVAQQSVMRRSKDEIELYDMCSSIYPDTVSNFVISDGWDADIVIPSIKTCVLWNGPWHYKQLNIKNHSLSQVQTRDNIKIKLFTDLGWTVLVYEDRHYTPLNAFIDFKSKVAGE